MSKRHGLLNAHPCHDCAVSAKALCCVLGVDELCAFRNTGTAAKLDPGQSLFHEGDNADCVFSLTEGVVKLYAILPDGRRQITDFLFAGDFLGLNQRVSHAVSAEAVTGATLCRFQTKRFEQYLETCPTLVRARYHALGERLAAAQEHVVTLGRRSAEERLAHFLCMVEARTRSIRPAGSMVINLPMSRTDIADHLGLTKETVSRCFTRMRKAGLIRLHSRRQTELAEPARIRRIALGGG